MALTNTSLTNASLPAGTKFSASLFTDLNKLLENDEGLDTRVTTLSTNISTLSSITKHRDCGGSCTGSCFNSCTGGCMATCTGACVTTCTGSCTGTCSTTCTGGCNGGCSCFTAGSLVLLEDGTTIPIENVKIGDRVVGLGGANTVLSLIRTTLGDRSLMGFQDTGAFFSSEHCFWIKDVYGEEYWGTHDFNMYMKERRYASFIVNGVAWKYGFSRKDPLVIAEEVHYATDKGWQKNKAVPFHSQHRPDIMLYQLVTDGSHSFFVNGYLVAGEAYDKDFDFTQFGGVK